MSINGGQLVDIAYSLTHELNKQIQIDLNTKGTFISGSPEINFKCLFYNTRTCHVREQMNITDEDLKKETAISKTDKIEFVGSKEGHEYPTYKNTQNTADWLVTKFCRICPHREA